MVTTTMLLLELFVQRLWTLITMGHAKMKKHSPSWTEVLQREELLILRQQWGINRSNRDCDNQGCKLGHAS